MRKLYLIALLLAVIALSVASYENSRLTEALATSNGNNGGHRASENVPQAAVQADSQAFLQRVLLTPFSSESEKELRGLLTDIRHEFKGKFTANVPTKLIPKALTLAEVEVVPVHTLHPEIVDLSAKPICGNGVAEGGEKCGEPGLSCPEGETCENCKCKTSDTEEPPPGRTCTPTNQVNYNVTQVNGAQAGSGAGVMIAVLDTGVDTDHLDLVNRLKVCKDATKGRGIKNGCEDKNTVAHGTHSAGVVAADGGTDSLGLFGVAPGADLMIIKVCGGGGGGGCFTDDIAAAIDFAGQNGAQIVNMSFGGSTESRLIRDAIARNPNLLYIASAGNSGPGANTIGYPGANPNVVAVAANDSGKVIASFSSRGIDDGNDATIVEREVELSAGGVAVESTNNDGCYSPLSGTSFSSPTVAGLAAKVWQGSASATRAYLVSLATDITQANGGGAGVGFDTASGYGLPVAP